MKDNYYNYNNLQNYCDQNKLRYDAQWLRWIKDIMNTKVSMFTYDNLPNDLTSQIIEMALLFNNFLCWYYDENLGGLILCRYRYGSEFDLYWKPKKVELLSISGKLIKTNVPYEDIILCRDNTMDIIPFLTLNGYMEKIMEMEDTLSINVQLVRLPAVFTCSRKQVATFKALFKDIKRLEPFVFGDKDVTDGLDQFDIKLPAALSDIYDLIDQYKNMALASMGIYGSDSKRERLITAEINANNDYTDFVYQGMLNERKLWIKQIKEKWNIDIKLNESYIESQESDTKLEAEKAGAIAEAENIETKKEEVVVNE